MGMMILSVLGRQEFALADFITERLGGVAYAPKCRRRVWVRRARALKVTERPVFSGYVFAEGFRWMDLRTAPGRPRINVIQGRVLELRETEVERLKARVAAGDFDDKGVDEVDRPGRRFNVGDVVGISRAHHWYGGDEPVRLLALPRSGRGSAGFEFVAAPGKRLTIDVSYLIELA